MDAIRGMRTFVRAVELGSLSAVAREQQTTQPTVSKVMASLEKELGVRLLERSTTSLTPTEQGKRFYERAKRVLEEFGEAVADVRGLTERPAGFLRVNAPVSLGQLRLNKLVLEFLVRYPDIEIELILNDRFIDLVEEGVDIAVRLGTTLPPNVVARKIAVSSRCLVASPAYLQSRPAIGQLHDLAQHQYIRFAWLPDGDAIELHGPEGKVDLLTKGRYRVNNALAIRESFLAGAGLGMAPAWLVQDLLDSGQLVKVLPKYSAPAQELFLLYPSRRYQSLRARLFMQFLNERVAQLPGFEGAGATFDSREGDG
ncbi:LysR family transcriptional regulator [Noviherbaspirillum cavernae]|uniref:LysR family transcriptional regulator n=1 Tax=Noviherbaspirillum cavernae TaxID=2320862 RepID=A0A418WX49_9BURK|nr:LysR family transcriptional regulator [Noviherbaspirillum cavernae]RJG04804.1 LysR family transcriptional regulator [Noviherbaspirillum cavernae]